MAKSFEFYGGPGGDQGALAQVLIASMQAAQDAAQTRARGYAFGADMALGGLSRGLNRGTQISEGKLNRALEEMLAKRREEGETERQARAFTFQEKERKGGEEFRATQEALDRDLREDLARRELSARTALEQYDMLKFLAGEAAEQGVPAPALMDRLMKMMEANPQLQQALGGGAPQLPGVPGGFPMEPGQDTGYQRLQGGTPSGFGDLEPVPQPPSVEQQRLNREIAMDQETMQAIAEATQFANSPQGGKALYIPIKMSLLEALGLDAPGLDPDVQEAKVLDLFPQAAPITGLEGKEDRTKLDKYLKWLSKETEVLVPNEAGFMQLHQNMATRLQSPKALDAAMKSIAPHTDLKPARSMTEAREVAKGYLLNRMQEIKQAGTPAQLQGGGDLLQLLQRSSDVSQLGEAMGEPKPANWTKGLIGELDLNYDQLEPELQAAAALEYPIAQGPDGRIIFLPTQDGTPVGSSTQAALDRLLARPGVRERLPALMAAGAEMKQTPSDLDKASEARKRTGKPQARAAPVTPRLDDAGAPEEPGRPTSQPRSALDEYRESKRKKSAPARRPPPYQFTGPPIAPPTSMSLLGRDPGELIRLLMGAGGLR